MTLHVISDLRRDVERFVELARLGYLGPDTLNAWADRLGRRVGEVEAFVDAAEIGGEHLVLTDARRFAQPGRRAAYTGHLAVVDGGRA